MSHVRNVTTAAEALSRIFNVPLTGPILSPTHNQIKARARCSFHQSSPFSTASTRHALNRPFKVREVDPSRFGPATKIDRPPRDEEIQSRRVYVRLPTGRLSEPRLLYDLLDSRERDEKGKYSQFVQEIAPASPQDGRDLPIVLVYDRKEAKDRELALKKKAKETKAIEKFLELGWSIEGKDLEHRIGKMKEFLEKGAKVDIVFGSRRRRGWGQKREVLPEEAQALLDRIRQAAIGVQGTKENGQMQGKLLGQAMISFQGPSKKEREQTAKTPTTEPEEA